jgi:hypothetical protein
MITQVPHQVICPDRGFFVWKPIGWGRTQIGWGRTQIGWGRTQIGWGRTQIGWGRTQIGWGRTQFAPTKSVGFWQSIPQKLSNPTIKP